MDDGKILVMGVGGSGSGFIWGLLGDCGYETKGINEWMRHSGVREAHANGAAHLIEYPTVIKHLGGFLTNLNMHIDQNGWNVKHIFFSVASYDFQIKTYMKRRQSKQQHFTTEERRELADRDYRTALGSGMIQLIERDHPFTMVRCPRSMKDPKYCYEQLKVVLDGMTYKEFFKIHQARVDPKLYKKLDGWD